MMGKCSLLAAMSLLILALLDCVLATSSSGCGKSSTITSGAVRTMTVNGKTRQYIVTLPSNYDNTKPHMLFFGLHWLGGTMYNVANGQNQLNAYFGVKLHSGDNAIFIAPQGLNNGWANSNGEDLTFIDNLITTVEAAVCIDQTQRFSMGWSYGASMTFALACSRATTFRAAAAISAGELSGCDGGTQPIAYFGLHGIRDPTLPIAGGRTIRDRFVKNNGCTPQNPKEPSQGSLTHIKTEYSGCMAGKPVWWLAFDAYHQASPQDGSTSDSATKSYVPGELWNFFSQFSGSSTGVGGGTMSMNMTTTAVPSTSMVKTTGKAMKTTTM